MRKVSNKRHVLLIIVISLAMGVANSIINTKYGEIKRKNNQRNVSSITKDDIVSMNMRIAGSNANEANTIITKDDIKFKVIMDIIGEIKNLHEYSSPSIYTPVDRKTHIIYIKTNKKPPLNDLQLWIDDDYIIDLSYKERTYYLDDILNDGKFYRSDYYFSANEKVKESIKCFFSHVSSMK